MSSLYPEGTYFQVVVVGGGGVGKSALTVRYMQDTFLENYDPTIEDTYTKHTIVDGVPYTVDIMDTAGQEDYVALRNQYLKEGHGFMLAFSVTSRRSFRQMKSLNDDVMRIKGTHAPDIPKLVVANKADILDKRKVGEAEAAAFAEEHECGYIETSALTNLNVGMAFTTMVRMIRDWQALHLNDLRPAKKCKRRLCVLF